MTQTERLQFLLRYLRNESSLYNIEIPLDISQQKHMLRALMNIRPPKPISHDFLQIQDAYLQREIADKGITDAAQLSPIRDRICLWQGDITTLKCGAIVNAANSQMLGCFVPNHGCIDNAIHTYAGIQLRLACKQIMEQKGQAAKTGQAEITPAFNLPCSYVLHTVGPIITGEVTQKDQALLSTCYQSCLQLAENNHVDSIAFCCISTGEFHYPNQHAAKTAISTVMQYLTNSNIKRVIFNVYKDTDYVIYKNLLRKY